MATLGNILWFVLGVSIIGLPFAKQHVKRVPLALMPFGRTLVADTQR